MTDQLAVITYDRRIRTFRLVTLSRSFRNSRMMIGITGARRMEYMGNVAVNIGQVTKEQ